MLCRKFSIMLSPRGSHSTQPYNNFIKTTFYTNQNKLIYHIQIYIQTNKHPRSNFIDFILYACIIIIALYRTVSLSSFSLSIIIYRYNNWPPSNPILCHTFLIISHPLLPIKYHIFVYKENISYPNLTSYNSSYCLVFFN